MKFFYLNVLLLFLIQYSIAEFEYIPSSRELEVIEESDYTFGIREDDTTNITRCYYTTDTDISGYFDVVKIAPPTTATPLENQLESNFVFEYKNFDEPQSNQEIRIVPNEITHKGEVGFCEMRIRWATDEGPTRWTLIPYSNLTGGPVGNLTEINYKIDFLYKRPVFTTSISIYESESFYQYLKVTDIKFQRCKLTFNDAEIELDLQSTRINSYLTPYSERDDETKNRISSLGHGLCGFKLENATRAESLKWTITVTDDQEKRYTGSFQSAILAKIDSSVLNTKQRVVIGESTYLSCGNGNQQKFCTLYNPSGKLVFTGQPQNTNCGYTIQTVGMDDIGIWKCITGNEYGLQPINYTVELITDINLPPVETWVNETDNTLNIGCRLTNYESGITFCKMIAPNQQVFSLRPGLATDRYLSFGTDFDKSICALEIPKPLLDFENGRWRCEITAFTIIGDFIDVNTIELPSYPKHLDVTVQLEQQYQIKCQVSYSSEYCHIKAPNGIIYPSKSEDEARLGRCLLEPMQINATHNGTWTCSFAQGIGVPDEEIFIEVTVAEVFQYYKTAEVDVGNTAQLMCKSGGLPLKYCRFIAPNGKSYQISNHQTSNTISYYGRGLEYGECGIAIANAQTSDNGYWTCVTRIGSDYRQPEIKAQIMLEVTPSLFDDPNIAAAIGIAVGVVVVTSVLGVVVVQRWRRRRHSQIAGSTITPRTLNDEDNNSETVDIFNVAAPPRSYTNPQMESVRDDSHEHQL